MVFSFQILLGIFFVFVLNRPVTRVSMLARVFGRMPGAFSDSTSSNKLEDIQLFFSSLTIPSPSLRYIHGCYSLRKVLFCWQSIFQVFEEWTRNSIPCDAREEGRRGLLFGMLRFCSFYRKKLLLLGAPCLSGITLVRAKCSKTG